jgi:type II restriction/modification system DNA methylase subunit YeeA
MIIDIESMIQIAINDWDSYETSWDFTTLPLLTEPYRSPELKTAWSRLRTHWIETTLEMQRLEEENNRIFIAAYGLEDELTPDVPLEEITLTCNPYYRYGNKVEESETSAPPSGITTDSTWPWNSTLEERLRSDTMRELLSYAVGCIFGRYSLDREGLVLANAREGLEEYLKSIPEPALMPDESGILPLTEEDDFSDDLPAFGPDHFDANIRFIEDAMGRDIRSYLLKDFYRDHVQRYKKRHIYWMATSPKGTFRALFYLHRYTPDTVGRLLNDYVRPFMKKLSNKIENDLHQLSFGSLSRADAARTQKRIDKHRDALKEIESWEKKVYETATRRIELDLDDGVKVNYGKLIDILEPVKGLDS